MTTYTIERMQKETLDLLTITRYDIHLVAGLGFYGTTKLINNWSRARLQIGKNYHKNHEFSSELVKKSLQDAGSTIVV